MKPVLYLNFANDKNNPLPNLQEEGDLVMQALALLAKTEKVQIHLDNFSTIDKVAEYLTLYKDQILLFHYAGHANSQHLVLTDQAANANGIAQLLAQQKNLQLVFLNGCSTKGQVKLLLELGIPTVIATTAAVNDKSAMEFAHSFYNAIANDYSIKAAFNIAAGVVEAKTGFLPGIYRDRTPVLEDNKEVLPWGLYTTVEDAVLDQVLIPLKVEPPSSDYSNSSQVTGNNNTVIQGLNATGPINININQSTISPMDVLAKSIPLILDTLSKQENSNFKEWIQPILWKEPIVKTMLTGNSPKEFKQEFLKNHVTTLLEEETFKTELTQWISKLEVAVTEKNIVDDSEFESKKSIHVGDTNPQSTQKFTKKNIVKRSKFKSGGDIHIGDKNV